MIKKLTFKEYLESKEQLKRALEQTPTVITEYTVRNYCSLPLGDNEDEKITIGFKPKQTLVVEWQYDNPQDPTPVSVSINVPNELEDTTEYPVFWPSKKLKKWLDRHTNNKKTLSKKTNNATTAANTQQTAAAVAVQTSTGSLGNSPN